ncbi:MAG: cupin domain-containing protein [Zoogloeaceae bacterium]|nr:cupin domain-containing protein [Zoogloeaceae bacterium]
MPTSAQPKTAIKTGEFFTGRSPPGGGEVVETLFARPGMRLERIASYGHASPPGFWYDQAEDEWALLLQGRAILAFDDGQELAMAPGTWVTLPAGCRHRVVSTSPDALWLAVFAPPGGEDRI